MQLDKRFVKSKKSGPRPQPPMALFEAENWNFEKKNEISIKTENQEK